MEKTLDRIFENATVHGFIREIIDETLGHIRSGRRCPKLEDEDFIFLNIARTLSTPDSGRDFLQMAKECYGVDCDLHVYYESLHSARRLSTLEEFHDAFLERARSEIRRRGVDYLDMFPELADRQVLAGDGHYHDHATHAGRTPAGKLIAPGSIYLLDMHTGTTAPLAVVQTETKKNHEIKALRKCLPSVNKGDAKKPIIVYDLAIQDKTFFVHMKLAPDGIDVVTKLKKTIKPIFEQPLGFDRDAEVNIGIKAATIAGLDNAGTVRLIYYVNPEDGEEHQFLTTDFELEPGVIAWLYLKRWDIEKVYDVKKNKLRETKAWATGTTAQRIHSLIISITMNLLRLILKLFESVFDLRELKLEKKREQWLKDREEKAKKKGGFLNPLARQSTHMFQLSAQFIRCVRNHFFHPKAIGALAPIFRDVLTAYLGGKT